MEDNKVKEDISFEDFSKVDIRVGKIVSYEQVPKSSKLLKLNVSFGSEIGNRTIVAGIAESSKDENGNFVSNYIDGYRCIFVLNLKPRSIMGIESHGMLLAVKNNENGKIWFLSAPPVEEGTKVG